MNSAFRLLIFKHTHSLSRTARQKNHLLAKTSEIVKRSVVARGVGAGNPGAEMEKGMNRQSTEDF